jgi:hypothetical protein
MGLDFDPIDEAARQWALRWDRVPAMHAVTSLMRVQQLVLSNLDAILKPHRLTFARYEALVLLVFSARGSLPMGKMGSGSRSTRRRSPRSSTGSRRQSSSYDVRIRRIAVPCSPR